MSQITPPTRERVGARRRRRGIDVADFAGWSGGGRALLEFALAYPDRVRTPTLVEPAAYWILEQLGEHGAEVEQANALIHGLAGRRVTEDDLAEFLRLAGLVQPGDDAREHPAGAVLPHRMALSWQSEELDRSDRSVDELRTRCPVLREGERHGRTGQASGRCTRRAASNATVVELQGDHAAHIQSIDASEALENHVATV